MMSRPKSYDRDDAVERSCRAFWASGYRALGVRALEQQTGLNQFAIRSEFGGKEGLYLEALKFYSEAAKATALHPMRNGGIEQISEFFKGLVTEGSPTSSEWGCLVVNTGMENAYIKSERLEAATQDYWTDLSAHFEGALGRSADNGKIKADLNIAETSQGLVAATMGVHTMNRASRSHNAGAPFVALICNYLKTLEIR